MRLFVILGAAVVLSACGTKGPLYLVGPDGRSIVRESQPGLRAPIQLPGAPAGAAAPAAATPSTPQATNVGDAAGNELSTPATDVGPSVPMTLPVQ